MNSSLHRILRMDHARVEEAFSKLFSAKKEKERLLGTFDLQNALVPHILAEEKEVLGPLEATGEKVLARHLRKELEGLRLELEKLSETPVNEDGFDRQLRIVRESWTRHSQEEERSFLPELDARFGDRTPEIAQRYTAERDRNTRSGPQPSRNWL